MNLLYRQATQVRADDVIITDTSDSNNGLIVKFYVRGSTGSISPSDVVLAVTVRINEHYFILTTVIIICMYI